MAVEKEGFMYVSTNLEEDAGQERAGDNPIVMRKICLIYVFVAIHSV